MTLSRRTFDRPAGVPYGRVPGAGLLAATLAGVGLAACSGTVDAPDAAPSTLSVWEAGTPQLSVGTLDGEDVYEFGGVQGVVSLADGGLAVADGLTGSISIFDAGGVFVRSMGTLGGGPGEFGTLSRIYTLGDDSLAAIDQRRMMVSHWSVDGEYAGQMPAAEVSGEAIYSMDVFPASRYIVDGAVGRDARVRVGALAATLPRPSGASLVRHLKVGRDGSLWVRESAGDSVTPSEWLVLDAAGAPQRWARLAPGFTPLEMDGDEVVGRRVGEYGVEYAERYVLTQAGNERNVPGWFSGTGSSESARGPDATAEGEPLQPMTESDLRAEAVRSIKFMASAQEIFYSRNYRYSTSMDELRAAEMPDGFELDLPEGFEFTILTAGSRGWSLVVAHPEVSTVCTLGYGLDTPPGWGTGAVNCGTENGIDVVAPASFVPPAQPKG